MRYCQPHWDRLRAAIESHGMAHLVTATGEQLVTDMVAEANGGDRAPLDPLLLCHNRVVERALRYFGTELLTLDEHGKDRCPVCMLLTLPDPCGRDREALERHYSDDLVENFRQMCRDWLEKKIGKEPTR